MKELKEKQFKGFRLISDLPDVKGEFMELKKILGKSKWFIAFGSALGLHRDGDFIPNDTDIDICVVGADEDLVQVLNKAYRLFRIVKVGDVYHQLAFQTKSGLVIDVCFMHFNEAGGNYISYNGSDYWMDSSSITKVDKVKTKYGVVNMPSNIEGYLTDHYGDWQVKGESKSKSWNL